MAGAVYLSLSLPLSFAARAQLASPYIFLLRRFTRFIFGGCPRRERACEMQPPPLSLSLPPSSLPLKKTALEAEAIGTKRDQIPTRERERERGMEYAHMMMMVVVMFYPRVRSRRKGFCNTCDPLSCPSSLTLSFQVRQGKRLCTGCPQ